MYTLLYVEHYFERISLEDIYIYIYGFSVIQCKVLDTYSTEKRILNIAYRVSCAALTILDTNFNYFFILYCYIAINP